MTTSQRQKSRSTSRYLSHIKSEGDRAGICAEMRRLLSQSSEAEPNRLSALNNRQRSMLAEAIFTVENRLEFRRGGQADHSRVVVMRNARNRVYDDLKWNELGSRPAKAGSA